ncbi:tRNA pseudouridine(38-40) synthase TruA [Thermococcus sp. Bubb.Bath]|uniref:tRNA pseudouridine(38-40) synthase TruA n=1 Tax=Thermococcus sp. Bubb.Bath TaxID=1638242 RepID=UPI00143ADF02|nr:tRNA pseudouridine(38-40) synthase TruA [Thermococcus sp. Bubb.Bath]NJF24681.1 tRNA pseudouridine(38-40) synthase TruA [Thermococcus sp. Bubb.Bath]
MKKLALRIAYDGTAFYGFQRQPGVRTVEGELIRVLKKLGIIQNPEDSDFKGASRTDRGVSAFFNVVSFVPNPEKAYLATPKVINHHLKDVWVIGRVEVPQEFHPRFWAREKTYRYYLVDRGYDVEAMTECSALFLGTHDFSAFAKLEPGKGPIREVTSMRIVPRKGYYLIEVSGKSFLWEMARRMMSAISYCGLGILSKDEVKEMLSGRFERKVPAAPPENLVLWRIDYEGITFDTDTDEEGLKKARREIFSRYSYALSRAALFGDWLISL